MARTPSKMKALGTSAPDFNLPDTEGKEWTLNSFPGAKGFLIMFICNHCPYVKHIAPALAQLTDQWMKDGIAVIGVNSNDVENYPEDSPEKMREEKSQRDYKFPYLYDETQDVAKAFDAACTPDFFLFDQDRKLYYRGQLDGSRPGNQIEVTGEDLDHAIRNLLHGKASPKDQKPSLGCNIKWKLETIS